MFQQPLSAPNDKFNNQRMFIGINISATAFTLPDDGAAKPSMFNKDAIDFCNMVIRHTLPK